MNTSKSNNSTSQDIEKVSGIFKNIGEEGRNQEGWVDALNDKVHLMRVDVTNNDNSQAVSDYKTRQTPLLILFDQDSIQLMEIVSSKTFEHAKDIYLNKIKQKQGYSHPDEENDEVLESAQKAAEEAKKAAADAMKAFAEAKKALQDHIKEENKNKADQEKKNQQQRKQQQQQQQNQSQGTNQNKGGNSQNLAGGVPEGYRLEYLPVLKKIDN